MSRELIEAIAKQLNVPKSSDNDYLCRTIYSVVGKMALSSLWDHTEDRDSVSIQHFKNRMEDIFDAYESLCPSLSILFPKDKTCLIEEIFLIYMRNGFFYHSAYQISPGISKISGYKNVVLHRGISFEEEFCMSGLGFYSMKGKVFDSTIFEMFGLQNMSFEKYLDEIVTWGEWEEVEFSDNTEFLRLKPPFTKGYWQKNPDKEIQLGLARYGTPNKSFVFYRWINGVYQQKNIPAWRLSSYFSDDTNGYDEYRRIAIALLKRYQVLPNIKVKSVGDLVEIKLGYRLPPSEEEFFKLYSWPVRYDFSTTTPQVFTRMMAKKVYPLFKYVLEIIGYHFEEG